jgi:4-hydroxyphenylpyruvate dioxygenase-like putative hemolysin
VIGVALDHVGVVMRDLAALAGQYERLGFLLTPLARHADGRIGNRCAMLRQGYIELLAVVDPTARSATLDRFLARYAGVHILAFAVDDTADALARLGRAGIAAPRVSEFERSTDNGDPSAPRARVALIQLPEQPEGRINLVHHLTPEALWQERFLQHPNCAVALDEVAIEVAEPAEATARFSRLVGCAAVPDAAGGFALDLGLARVRLLPSDDDASIVPRIVALGVRTQDGNAAIGRLLRERGVTHACRGQDLVVDADEAGGVALRFRPG